MFSWVSNYGLCVRDYHYINNTNVHRTIHGHGTSHARPVEPGTWLLSTIWNFISLCSRGGGGTSIVSIFLCCWSFWHLRDPIYKVCRNQLSPPPVYSCSLAKGYPYIQHFCIFYMVVLNNPHFPTCYPNDMTPFSIYPNDPLGYLTWYKEFIHNGPHFCNLKCILNDPVWQSYILPERHLVWKSLWHTLVTFNMECTPPPVQPITVCINN